MAHCVLNQNSVIKGWARARGAFPAVVQGLLSGGVGMIQLPCPEKTFGGLNRPPMTVEEYDTEEYHNHCRSLLEVLIEELRDYRVHGVQLVGVIGIEDSPSCCVNQGIFYQELLRQLKNHGFSTSFVQIPPDYQEEDGQQNFLTVLEKWGNV